MSTENITVKRNHHFTGSITFWQTSWNYSFPILWIWDTWIWLFFQAFILKTCYLTLHDRITLFYGFRNLMQFFEESNEKKKALGSWNMYCMSVSVIDVQHLLCLLVSHHLCDPVPSLPSHFETRTLDLTSHQCWTWHHLNQGEKYISSIWQKISLWMFLSQCNKSPQQDESSIIS